jgi:hypothetical protein
MRKSPIKKRSNKVYQKKIDKVTKWYEESLELREKPVVANSGKESRKRKELKPLDFYLNKIKKPFGGK